MKSAGGVGTFHRLQNSRISEKYCKDLRVNSHYQVTSGYNKMIENFFVSPVIEFEEKILEKYM